jgi:hypothetical protein
MMLLSEEVRRPLQGPVELPPTKEIQHGNHTDRYRSAVLARWRGMGIFSMARLARSREVRVNVLLDPMSDLFGLENRPRRFKCQYSEAIPHFSPPGTVF